MFPRLCRAPWWHKVRVLMRASPGPGDSGLLCPQGSPHRRGDGEAPQDRPSRPSRNPGPAPPSTSALNVLQAQHPLRHGSLCFPGGCVPHPRKPLAQHEASWQAPPDSGQLYLLRRDGATRAHGTDFASPAGQGWSYQTQGTSLEGESAPSAHFWLFFPRLSAQAHREGWVPLLTPRKGRGGLPQDEAEGGQFQVNAEASWDRRKFQAFRKSIC